MKLSKTNTTITQQDIDNWEQKEGIVLDKTYQRFLLEYNGAEPTHRQMPVDNLGETIIVNSFFSLEQLQEEYKKYENVLPKSLLPIGFDELGNRICINRGTENNGKIYYYDLRWDLEDDETPEVFQYYLADDMLKFINQLQNDVIQTTNDDLLELFSEPFKNENQIISLINDGWDVNTLIDGEYTAMQRLVLGEKINVKIADLLIEKSAKLSGALEQATVWNNLEAINYLIQHGADVNETNQENTPLLIEMVKSINIPVIQLLLQHGADKEASDNDGHTAKYWAKIKAKQGYKEAKKVLALLK
ncbi:SMI1/KNR4 family protein [uncultured Microscilla sp.]|uniref:SMI1/KNR4 family protein n=1 Tax=uncultured Microscilla sp. TaxID=432653 RepID=UPI00261762C9|nr:SMI1/KNR4 family protein [uncultured Microscilla sp.]